MFLYLKIIFFRKELKKNLDFLNYSHFLKKFSSEMKISNERISNNIFFLLNNNYFHLKTTKKILVFRYFLQFFLYLSFLFFNFIFTSAKLFYFQRKFPRKF